jgi:hypothetical protein
MPGLPSGVTNIGSLVSIAGVNVPKGASTLVINYYDVSDPDSGNSINGSMWKGYVGSKRKLEITWNALYPTVIETILTAVKGKNSFAVKFYDPESGSYVTSNFYAGDRKTDFKWFYRNHELIGLTMSLIEVDCYT